MYAYIAPTTTREFTVYGAPCTVAVGTHVCIYCPHHHTWVHRVRCTVYGSCTWLTCMRTAPHHLPKKVTKKPSVNHIGSSNDPPIIIVLFRGSGEQHRDTESWTKRRKHWGGRRKIQGIPGGEHTTVRETTSNENTCNVEFEYDYTITRSSPL